MIVPNPKYRIGTRVYHITKESDQGVIINARYSLRHAYWVYVVSFNPGSECDLYEDEISENISF